MFEKFKARFDLQKSDDAFVEAATNASVRQQMIDKLVIARAKINRAMMIIAVLCLFVALLEIIQLFIPDPSATSRSPDGAYQGFTIMVIVVILHSVIDLQIKFLKALEAGASVSVG